MVNLEDTQARKKSSVMQIMLVAASSLLIVSCSNSKKPELAATPAVAPSANISTQQEVIGGVPLQRPQLVIANQGTDSISGGSHAVGQNFAALPEPQPSGNVISNQTKFSSKKYGVAGSPRVTTDVKVRKGGGRYQVGKPYTIRGKRYVPREDPNYKSKGLASWYGPNFHGRLTANGEVYDQFALSAAHPTMPLPSYARVTNLENGASLIVRVNDRGPFAPKRVIDLSARAAELLGYTKKGLAPVTVEYVGKARMNGLDEAYLMASYNPGSLGGGTLVASAQPTPQSITPTPSRQTLDAFDNGRFGLQNAGQDISAVQTPPQPGALVSGYAAADASSSAELAFASILNSETNRSARLGMADLQRIKVLKISSKDELFNWSEKLSAFGPVSTHEQDKNGQFSLSAIIPQEDLPAVKALFD